METLKTPDGRTVQVLVPYVVDEICNGCGICEYVCPLEGKSGIEIFAVKDKTPIREVASGFSSGGSVKETDPYK
jgi:ferredoxin